MTIKDLREDVEYICPANRWLDVERNDKSLCTFLPAIREEEEQVSVAYVLKRDLTEKLLSNHDWFSVYAKSPFDVFTRAQR